MSISMAPRRDLETIDQAKVGLALESELAVLIVDVLQLEIAPDAIAPTERLFGEGLGLDSIDALELALAISKRYGVILRSDDERNTETFRCLRSLADFVAASRAEEVAAGDPGTNRRT